MEKRVRERGSPDVLGRIASVGNLKTDVRKGEKEKQLYWEKIGPPCHLFLFL